MTAYVASRLPAQRTEAGETRRVVIDADAALVRLSRTEGGAVRAVLDLTPTQLRDLLAALVDEHNAEDDQ